MAFLETCKELNGAFGAEGNVLHLDGSRSTLSRLAQETAPRSLPSRSCGPDLEARSQELMEAKRDEVLAVINE